MVRDIDGTVIAAQQSRALATLSGERQNRADSHFSPGAIASFALFPAMFQGERPAPRFAQVR
jgi:hypothetical protein